MKNIKEIKAWVESSNVVMFFYSPKTQDLEVQFHGGGLYVYRKVPEEVVLKWLMADSVGKYFSEHIKKVYETERL